MKIISFIIPTYNRAECIGNAIQSIVEQTNSSWELLIIDDGSLDNTKEIVSPFLIDERIQYYLKSHSGVSASRNHGARLAAGDELIFLDSDDWVGKNLVNQVLQINHNADLICWEVRKVTEQKSEIWRPRNLGKVYNNITANFLAGSYCINKNLFNKVGGYDENLSYGENYELGLRISQHVKRVIVIDKAFLQNNVRKDRNAQNSRVRLQSCLYQYKKHKLEFQKDPVFESRFNYLIGYLLERLGKKSFSKIFYKRAWVLNPLNYKAFLKNLYYIAVK